MAEANNHQSPKLRHINGCHTNRMSDSSKNGRCTSLISKNASYNLGFLRMDLNGNQAEIFDYTERDVLRLKALSEP